MVRWLYLFENQLALFGLLLLFGKTLGVFQFRYGRDAERHIMGDALSVVGDESLELFAHRSSYKYQFRLHSRFLMYRFFFQELLPLRFVAVEDIHVDVWHDAFYVSIG